MLYLLQMSDRVRYLLLCIVCFFVTSNAYSETLTGKVVSVADGDTITILTTEKHQLKVRLYGIDCPESSQSYGNKAKQFTSSVVYGKNVTVDVYDTDRYGRSVGVVRAGTVNVNEELLKNGYAWEYPQYCKQSFCNEWMVLESTARNARIGLWKDGNPVPPWEYRKDQRNNGNSTNKTIAEGAGIYHGNSKSHILHSSSCQHYNCKNCTVVFSSLAEGLKSGYRAHESCMKTE